MSSAWADGRSRPHMSAQDMDQKRKDNVAYEYLCHLEEARMWISKCLDEELPPATELEPALTNGVFLAKLGHYFAPQVVSKKKIYDPDLEKFNATGLHFKHTDNINFWMIAMEKEGLPAIFFPTTTDIYDRKNIPKAVYCLHALSIFLYRRGKAPAIQNLVGEAEFTQEEISNMQAELDKYGIQMPAFGKIGGVLAASLTADDAAVHAAVLVINEAIDSGDADALLEKLSLPAASVFGIDEANRQQYIKGLATAKEMKILKTAGKEEADLDVYDRMLTQEEINNSVQSLNAQVKVASYLNHLHNTILSGDADTLLSCLAGSATKYTDIIPECGSAYLKEMRAMASDSSRSQQCPWTKVDSSSGLPYYYNRETGEQQFTEPEGFTPVSQDLTPEEMQSVINRVNEAYREQQEVERQERELERELERQRQEVERQRQEVERQRQEVERRQKELEASERIIVEIQSRWRGCLLRRAFNERLAFLQTLGKQAVIIQAYWHGMQQRRKYQARLTYFRDHVKEVVLLQAACRGAKTRKVLGVRRAFFNDHVSAVVKIQAHVRGLVSRQYYRKLLDNRKPPPSALRKFLHLLEANEKDYQEEGEIQRLKAGVVGTIRNQKELEENLNLMDIKIGLLVKNRLDLDDVVHQSAKLNKKAAALFAGGSKGLKSLSKENRDRLEGYQHLFYLLQTNPSYLARLIFQMPAGRSTRFIENVIFTLFNYASNQREEYLLMKLFEVALHAELKTMDGVTDIAKGNATVMKMVITFNRRDRGQSSLRELVLPLVNRIIKDNSLNMNVNPIDIYKAWINQQESETGERCGLPYEVSKEQALSHPEVQQRLAQTVKTLEGITEEFVTSLTASVTKIPYGIRYFAMRIRLALAVQFPDASREEVLRVVGNFLYYRFMNPAVVAPDVFDIVELSLDKGLTTEQRRNLGSIGKVLQHASANKPFDGENSALSPLNPMIEESHVKFLNFFMKASTVEDSATHYNQDEYAEMTQLTKPVVYISVKEICNTHKLLLEHEESLTEDEKDPLHVLLREIGPAPAVHEILGDAYKEPPSNATPEHIQHWEERVAEGGKSEITLTLKNRFDVASEDTAENLRNVFKAAKRMAAAVMQAQPGDNLKHILFTHSKPEHQVEFQRVIDKRRTFDEKRAMESAQKEMDASMESPYDLTPEKSDTPVQDSLWLADELVSLRDTKAKLRETLTHLANHDMVSADDNYQAILDSMAKDIRNQNRQRQQRKVELSKLTATLASLEAKGRYYEDQKEYYQMYVNACLSNLTKQKSKKKESSSAKKVKYNAHKLYEKGVILEIEGLTPGQFKSVTFEIESIEAGKFNVSAMFMGVNMDSVELDFEDLLERQYNGVAVYEMFNRAKINVNLLIFLINKKFFGQ